VKSQFLKKKTVPVECLQVCQKRGYLDSGAWGCGELSKVRGLDPRDGREWGLGLDVLHARLFRVFFSRFAFNKVHPYDRCYLVILGVGCLALIETYLLQEPAETRKTRGFIPPEYVRNFSVKHRTERGPVSEKPCQRYEGRDHPTASNEVWEEIKMGGSLLAPKRLRGHGMIKTSQGR